MADDKQQDSYHGNNLVGHIRSKFQESETSKIYDEKRWLKAYRNYRGIYGPEMAFRDNEKSKVFVKITKTKVLAAFGQIIEVLFSQGKFPLGIKPTPVPENSAEYARLNPQAQQEEEELPKNLEAKDIYGYVGDGKTIPPGTTASDLLRTLAVDYEKLGFEEGSSIQGEPQIEPANMAAEAMEKLVHDQLEESKAVTIMRHTFFEMALMGTGIIKGPFTNTKTYHSYDRVEDVNIYVAKEKTVPRFEFIKEV